MPRLSRFALPVLGLTALAGLAWYLFPTDARRIRAACEDLARLVSVAPNEPDLARVSRAAGVAQHLAIDVVVEAEGVSQRIEGRETVVGHVARIPTSPLGITVTLDDVDVAVARDGRQATARATVTAREPDPRGGPDLVETRELTLNWVKVEDGWRLARVTAGVPGESGGAAR